MFFVKIGNGITKSGHKQRLCEQNKSEAWNQSSHSEVNLHNLTVCKGGQEYY